MKLTFASHRLLAIVAHPDDAELLCAGTLARAKADGAAIGICVMCQGDKGQPAKPIRNLAAIRRREMTAAVRLLGAELLTVGTPDGTLTDNHATRRKLTEHLRRFRPTLILAHAPQDYHPDHRAASALAEAASWFCASRGYRTKSEPLAAAPALWHMDTLDMLNFQPGFYMDITPYLPLKKKMLACHQSQLARSQDHDFSPLADLMRRQSEARGHQSGVAAAEAFCQCQAFKRVRAW
jgi:LmbE family N-acetylglucosaminyl deacetylase